jgi:hypothetical protein
VAALTAVRGVDKRIRTIVLTFLAVTVGWPLAAAILPDGAPIGVVLQGVVFGTVTALLAMGLILIYRSDSIVNFAYGSMGGVGAVLSVSLYLDAHLPYLLAAFYSPASASAASSRCSSSAASPTRPGSC